MDMGEQEFRYALVPHGGCWTKKSLAHRSEVLNMPLISIVETYHEGPLGPVSEGIGEIPENVSIGALKRSEDGTGYVLRFTETQGKPVQAEIELKLASRAFALALTPWELKTVYLPDDPMQPAREILITEL
jgi:alpha-mannosidase